MALAVVLLLLAIGLWLPVAALLLIGRVLLTWLFLLSHESAPSFEKRAACTSSCQQWPCPVSDFVHQLFQGHRVHRLDQVGVKARFQGLGYILGLTIA